MKTFSSWLTLETYHIFDVQTTVAGVGRVKSQRLLGIRNSLQTYMRSETPDLRRSQPTRAAEKLLPIASGPVHYECQRVHSAMSIRAENGVYPRSDPGSFKTKQDEGVHSPGCRNGDAAIIGGVSTLRVCYCEDSPPTSGKPSPLYPRPALYLRTSPKRSAPQQKRGE